MEWTLFENLDENKNHYLQNQHWYAVAEKNQWAFKTKYESTINCYTYGYIA